MTCRNYDITNRFKRGELDGFKIADLNQGDTN